MEPTATQQYKELLKQQQYEQLCNFLDQHELEVDSKGDGQCVSKDWPRAAHMFALMLCNRLPQCILPLVTRVVTPPAQATPTNTHMEGDDSRFLWRRLTQATKRSDERAAAAFQVLQHIWNIDYQGVYPILKATNWPNELTLLVHDVSTMCTRHAWVLVQKTYRSIGVQQLALMTGVDDQQAIEEAQARGMHVDTSTNVVHIPLQCQTVTKNVMQQSLEKLSSVITQFN